MSNTTDIRVARTHRSREELAAALRAKWRMIAAVSIRPRGDGEGFEADLRLDPIVVKGSLEQQGYPRTPEDATKIEARRLAVLDRCVQQVNEGLAAAEQITSFSVVG